MRLSELAMLNDYRIEKDGEFEALGLLDSPVSRPILVFIGDKKLIKQFGQNVSCVICPSDVVADIPENIGVVVSANPKQLFFELHNHLSEEPPLGNARFSTTIGNKCSIHKMAYIADNNVVIGNNVVIEEFVSIKENTVIGDNVIIRAGTVIGGMGFYFTKNSDNEFLPVNHFGGVVIEDNVELQQSCCVDRAYFPWDNTVIGQGTKLDNYVHIAHAVKIGKRVLITSCVSIAGNVIIGDDSYIGPGSIFSNNVTAGESARVSLGSVVARNVPEKTTVTGNFAIDHSLFMSDLKEKFKRK